MVEGWWEIGGAYWNIDGVKMMMVVGGWRIPEGLWKDGGEDDGWEGGEDEGEGYWNIDGVKIVMIVGNWRIMEG